MTLITAHERPACRRLALFLAGAALLALATLLLGAVERAGGAGLACPDWPLCRGRGLPPLAPGVLLALAHQAAAGGVALATLGAYVLTWRSPQLGQAFGLQTGAAVALVATECALGAVAVLRRLPAEAVSAHMIVALLLLTVLLWAAMRAWELGRGPVGQPLVELRAPRAAAPDVPARLRGALAAAATLAFGETALGGLLGPFGLGHPALLGWHRVLGLALLALTVGLGLAAARRPLPLATRLGIRLAPGLVVLQIALGMVNVLGAQTIFLVVAHLGAAILLYSLLLMAAVAAAPGGGHRAVVRLPVSGDWRLEDRPI